MTPITPQTHPNFFYTRALNGHEYYVPNYITFEYKRKWSKANEAAYRAAKPEECTPDMDIAKFNAWLDTDEGEMAANCEIAKVLFTPKDGAPEVDYRIMPIPMFNEAYNFFDRKLPASTFVHTDAAVPANASTPVA